MRRSFDIPGRCTKLFLSTVGLMTVGASIGFGLIHQPQGQDKSTNRPALEYDVASIKRTNLPRGTNLFGRIGTTETPDGLTARVVTVKQLVQRAYAVGNYQISGAPDWINSEPYDLDAKFDSSVADELQKLNPNDRIIARQHMLQTLLAERFNLAIHRENKELQIYALIVAKNGPKLQEAKLDDTESSKSKGGPAPGTGYMTAEASGAQMRGYASPLSNLTVMLTTYLHRPVLDRTGLTGKYDYTLRWTPDENPTQPSSGIQGSAVSSPNVLPSRDPTGSPSLFTAIQEQLGLKLESAKGPVEIIVVDHVERPSGN